MAAVVGSAVVAVAAMEEAEVAGTESNCRRTPRSRP